MTTQTHQMTGAWVKVADGDVDISTDTPGLIQVQADGASAATLARNYGQPIFGRGIHSITAGSLAVYARGKIGDIWTVTGSGAVAGIDVRIVDGTVNSGATTTLTRISTPGANGALQDGMVIGLVDGATSASVEFAGTITGSDTIQIRVIRESNGSVIQDWTDVAIAADGAWSGTISLPKGDGWWLVQHRPKNNQAAVVAETERWGVGFKVLLMGQSQVVIMLRQVLSVHDMQHPDTASFYDNQDAAPIFGLIDTNTAGGGLQAMVDQFREFDPDTPLMLVREAVSGQGTLDFVDDSRPGRSFQDMQDRVDAYGGDYTAVVQMWPSEDSGDFSNDAEPPYRILIGDTDWIASSPYSGQVDHTLADVLQPGYVFAQHPATRHSYSLGDMRASEITVANTFGLPVGPPIVDFRLEWLGSTIDNGHPEPEGPGNIRFGARMGVTIARALGLDTSENPYIAGTAELSADSKFIVVPLTPVNGGSMYAIEPSNLSGWRVDNVATGFVAELHGNDVWLVKDSGTWASNATVAKVSNLTLNTEDTEEREIEITQGEVYETWAPDILGLGIPVHGLQVGGEWTLPSLSQTSALTTGTQTASAPDTFAAADWTATDAANGGDVNIGIVRLPRTNGSPLTAMEYRIDGGAWTSAGGFGDFTLSGLTVDTAIDIELRVVNAEGNGSASDTKSATPTGAVVITQWVRTFDGETLGDDQTELDDFSPVGSVLAEVVANAGAPGGQALAFFKTTGNLNELTDTDVTTAASAGFTTLTFEGEVAASGAANDRYFVGWRKGSGRMSGLIVRGADVLFIVDNDETTLDQGVGGREVLIDGLSQGTAVKFKLEVTGDTMQGKAWLSSGSEPGSYTDSITTSDNSAITVDSFGLFARTNGTAANSAQMFEYTVNIT